MVTIGREAIMSALDHIGVSKESAWSITSSLLLIQQDEELSFWELATEVQLQDFVDDCNIGGPFSLAVFTAAERLQRFVNILIDFFGPDDHRASRLGSGMSQLMCAAQGCV